MNTDKPQGFRVITVGTDTAQGGSEDRYPRIEVSLPTIPEWVEANIGPIAGPYPYQQALIDAALDGKGELKMIFTDGDTGRAYVLETELSLPSMPELIHPDVEARIARLEYERDVWRAKAAMRSKLEAPRPRFFIDTLTTTGDVYMIPADRRAEWHAFDITCEETSEALPVPDWARAIAALSHVEFEIPEEIFK